jgi:hypothetical protein
MRCGADFSLERLRAEKRSIFENSEANLANPTNASSRRRESASTRSFDSLLSSAPMSPWEEGVSADISLIDRKLIFRILSAAA